MARRISDFDVLPYEVEGGMFVADAEGEHICHCPHPSLEVMATVATVKTRLTTETDNKSAALAYTLTYLSSAYVGVYEMLYRIVNGRTAEERERAFEAADAYFRLGFADADTPEAVEGITLDCKRMFDLLASESMKAKDKKRDAKKGRT